ncbi:DUF7344 domain-containing protein [Halalkalicoccus jeotgali]|uniref:DUF7344 domain-containing protein n=1 Tax=Halalkalicoccus jeotgali (strain DSM 18796 / CECT 7217 / JCM 14584 / KCTC 4019 / B3) TaxID=795797 RepID=D8J6V2_HALJB|nr:hypothetical protein [Halalkalicoccus jeotgali]ADJ15905.1 hypothetical protein HacjB3_12620 [Halalkalicoccus jeotgali B3]ELY38001.1 hypothetical protein C497_07824 [Halalkalicoccus jeotgali B3]
MVTGSNQHLTEAQIHDVLRNDRRRAVISTLGDADGVAQIRDLADRIASTETGTTPPPQNARQSVYVSLHQTHLPKLDSLGVVEYDTDTNTVSLREEASEVAAYMGGAPGSTVHWARIYLALSVLGLVKTVVALLAIEPLTRAALVGALIMFVVMMGLAGYHVWLQRDRPLR